MTPRLAYSWSVLPREPRVHIRFRVLLPVLQAVLLLSCGDRAQTDTVAPAEDGGATLPLLGPNGCIATTADPAVPKLDGCENPCWLAERVGSACAHDAYRYDYAEAEVFLFPATYCRDFPALLFNRCGELICSSGNGWGRDFGSCEDFYEQRIGEQLLWDLGAR
jgi:hypothetical protein